MENKQNMLNLGWIKCVIIVGIVVLIVFFVLRSVYGSLVASSVKSKMRQASSLPAQGIQVTSRPVTRQMQMQTTGMDEGFD